MGCRCEVQLVVGLGGELWGSHPFIRLTKDNAWCEDYREP